jgi:5-oxoprolinase (ATP-hydrolysing) subunit C
MAQLRLLSAGPGATVQDAGRFGYRRYGVTPAGPMDWAAFRTANLALGNRPDAAAAEIGPGGLEVVLESESAAGIAFAGGGFSWFRDGQLVGPAARLTLRPGERLVARPGVTGIFTYLAVAGGLQTRIELGSRATHTRSGLGGPKGGPLQSGDCLPVGEAKTLHAEEAMIVAPWLRPDLDAPLRVVLGPQNDYFDAAAIDLFFNSSFRIADGDRMAYRLDGPLVAHSRGFNIVSDGVAMGAVQIAGDKKPIVLMADHPPTGGYPKLGHIARVDIGRLAQLRPGRMCRFAPMSAEAARDALLLFERHLAATTHFCRPLSRQVGLI